ncbi:Haloacid dehalogenase-like hydrolase [Balamuthia mandrillaris]
MRRSSALSLGSRPPLAATFRSSCSSSSSSSSSSFAFLCASKRFYAVLKPRGLLGAPHKKALIFDANGVLYTRKRSRQQALLHATRNESIALNPPSTPEQIEHRTKTMADLREKAFRGLVPIEAYYDAILLAAGFPIDRDEQVRVRGHAILREVDADVELRPFVAETLHELRCSTDIKLAVLTDSAATTETKKRWLAHKLSQHHPSLPFFLDQEKTITQLWHAFVNSAHLGTRKPDPRMYEVVLEELQLAAEEVAFVGHRRDELEGALRLKVDTIVYNPDPDVTPELATWSIERFDQLLELSCVKESKGRGRRGTTTDKEKGKV